MLLTQTLLGRLYKKISRDPLQFLALRLTADGLGMTWQVADDVLTTAPLGGGIAQPLTIDLTQYTILSLVGFLAAQPGYTVLYIDTTARGTLSAAVLLDATNDSRQSNGDHFFGYQSRLYAWLNTLAGPLKTAAIAICAMPAEMSTTTADGPWLDFLGGYYDVPRQAGEADAQYGPRIIAEVISPKSNNVAIANLITAITGQQCRVVDVVTYGSAQTFNGSFNFDGSQTYSANQPPIYGLFDVTTGFDMLGGTDRASFSDMVRNLIERIRAGGTQMRTLALQGSTITDSYAGASDGTGAIPLGAAFAFADSTPTPDDSNMSMAVDAGLADSYAPAGDALGLNVSYATLFNGVRRFDGSVVYASGDSVSAAL
jgi:hypothetical protein